MDQAKTLIVVAGPTAVGKTAISIQLAKKLKTEIISADARQFYSEMSIGTARPSETEMQGVVHHFMGFCSIENPLTVGKFEEQAIALITRLFERNNHLILTGGSGLYIRAITDGLDEIPEADDYIRTNLMQDLEFKGIEALQKLLKTLDSEHYKRIDLYNPHRLVRALEVCLQTGLPYSSFLNKPRPKRPFKLVKLALNLPRNELYNRINLRVDTMIKDGLEYEVASLMDKRNLGPLQTVGYSEFFDFFDGLVTRHQAIELIKRNTRRYAKRQLTWFNKFPDYTWYQPNQLDLIQNFIENAPFE